MTIYKIATPIEIPVPIQTVEGIIDDYLFWLAEQNIHPAAETIHQDKTITYKPVDSLGYRLKYIKKLSESNKE